MYGKEHLKNPKLGQYFFQQVNKPTWLSVTNFNNFQVEQKLTICEPPMQQKHLPLTLEVFIR